MAHQFDWFFEETPREGRRLAFDIETNGLLDTVSTVHSLVIKDIDTGEVWSCIPTDRFPYLKDTEHNYLPLSYGLEQLEKASIVFGHNIVGYDIPVLQKLYPEFALKGIARDTLMLAKMIWPVDSLKQLDFPRWRKGILPGQLIGAHKLEAWGYRLGLQKGEYSATVKALAKEYADHKDRSKVPEEYHSLFTEDDKLFEWAAWCKPMQDYCEVDVEVTHKLLNLIEAHLSGTAKAAHGVAWSPRSVKLEADMWQLCLDIEANGFGYNLEQAIELTSKLKTRQSELEAELKEVFGAWWQPLDDPEKGIYPAKNYSEVRKDLPDVTIRRFSEKTGKELKPYVGPPKAHYSTDSAFVRIKWTEFNPKSRQHLGDRLQAVFGWVPTEFGGAKGDQAKVDETTIKAIPTTVIPETLKASILEYLVVSKTLGQMADGRKSWNDLCAEDGAIHGRIDPLGTVSHRGAHNNPNLGQVPSVSVKEVKDDAGKVVSKEVIYGWRGGFGAECRSLFRPVRIREGWVQTGTDAAGLELRGLGHELFPYDGGEFARRVSTPGLDIHQAHADIAEIGRGDAKTTIYLLIYGGGNLKLGEQLGVTDEEVGKYADDPSAKSYVNWAKKNIKDFVIPDRRTMAMIAKGADIKKRLVGSITGLKELQADAAARGQKDGFLVALDGRKLTVRKAHASLNQLLLGGGSIICKKWLLEMRVVLAERGYLWDRDYRYMAWVHDEVQVEHRPGLEDVIRDASAEAMNRVAAYYDFRGELGTDSKSGLSWKDCH